MRTLMYVERVDPEGLTLSSYHNEGVFMPMTLPDDLMRKLRGRQCWVKGEWGGRCEIEKWEPLPVFKAGNDG